MSPFRRPWRPFTLTLLALAFLVAICATLTYLWPPEDLTETIATWCTAAAPAIALVVTIHQIIAERERRDHDEASKVTAWAAHLDTTERPNRVSHGVVIWNQTDQVLRGVEIELTMRPLAHELPGQAQPDTTQHKIPSGPHRFALIPPGVHFVPVQYTETVADPSTGTLKPSTGARWAQPVHVITREGALQVRLPFRGEMRVYNLRPNAARQSGHTVIAVPWLDRLTFTLGRTVWSRDEWNRLSREQERPDVVVNPIELSDAQRVENPAVLELVRGAIAMLCGPDVALEPGESHAVTGALRERGLLAVRRSHRPGHSVYLVVRARSGHLAVLEVRGGGSSDYFPTLLRRTWASPDVESVRALPVDKWTPASLAGYLERLIDDTSTSEPTVDRAMPEEQLAESVEASLRNTGSSAQNKMWRRLEAEALQAFGAPEANTTD